MGVPAPVEELDETHAALGEAAGEQAVIGKGFLPRLVPYIAWMCVGLLLKLQHRRH